MKIYARTCFPLLRSQSLGRKMRWNSLTHTQTQTHTRSLWNKMSVKRIWNGHARSDCHICKCVCEKKMSAKNLFSQSSNETWKGSLTVIVVPLICRHSAREKGYTFVFLYHVHTNMTRGLCDFVHLGKIYSSQFSYSTILFPFPIKIDKIFTIFPIYSISIGFDCKKCLSRSVWVDTWKLLQKA